LPETNNEFVQALERDITEFGAGRTQLRISIKCVKVPPFDSAALVELLNQLNANEIEGVSVFGPDTPDVCRAIEQARSRGIAVATLVADLPSSNRHHFIGIDNVAAGRTAARLMGRFMAGVGNILIITGSRLANDHLERIKGFEALLSKHYPKINVVTTLEGQDNADLIHASLPAVFADNTHIHGVYSAAAGNPGLIRFLQETGNYENMVTVAHELTDSSRKALMNGIFDVVISQDTGHLVRSATRRLMATADHSSFDHSQERIRIDIHLCENIPSAIRDEQENYL